MANDSAEDAIGRVVPAIDGLGSFYHVLQEAPDSGAFLKWLTDYHKTNKTRC